MTEPTVNDDTPPTPPSGTPDAMRVLAVFFIVAGLLVAAIAPFVVSAMNDNAAATHDRVRLSAAIRGYSYDAAADTTNVMVPVFFGLGVSALGIIVLAIRRPAARNS